ncbi:MAG: pyrimidine dimer DNA glycosylase/endonuclease V [Candidatus Nanoarchaeia archaeon]|nr:pyrimidine dimer DNA glycosylase/endonuclease V [Candidatus Nanoarchaeia archaeon]
MRVNLINPRNLADQHLVAEYGEILMALNHIKKYPFLKNIPKNFCLGTGHIVFFKNKVKYLEKRHKLIVKEMLRRGFRVNRKFSLTGVNKKLVHDWKPSKKDKEIIKKRLIYKINLKPEFYRYNKEHRSRKFFVDMIKRD